MHGVRQTGEVSPRWHCNEGITQFTGNALIHVRKVKPPISSSPAYPFSDHLMQCDGYDTQTNCSQRTPFPIRPLTPRNEEGTKSKDGKQGARHYSAERDFFFFFFFFSPSPSTSMASASIDFRFLSFFSFLPSLSFFSFFSFLAFFLSASVGSPS